MNNWIRKYLDAGENADSLVPQTRLRGNHRRRLAYHVIDITWKMIDAVYLVRNGLNVAGLHDELVRAIRRWNRTNPDNPLTAPSLEAVHRMVRKLCKFTVVYCRKGEHAARLRFRTVSSGLLTERANEIWEIDDTESDLICLHADRKTVIGRPWLTVVIDVHSRMIMAVVLTFSPPNTETALEAMRQAMKRKDAIVADGVDLESDWPAHGRPDFVHVDNGKNFNSAAFKSAVTGLGIQHKTLPLLKPWYKGTVERSIGTIMRQVFHRVPGSTYANIFERDRQTPPETVAVATLAQAQERLLRWVVNTYQHKHHRGIADTPYNLWQASAAKHGLRLPPPDGKIDRALSVTVARKIRNGAIQLQDLRYISAHALRLEMASGSELQREVIVRRNPGDLTVIEFLDAGVSNRSVEDWHEATICPKDRPRVEGRTLVEYNLAKALRAADRDLANRDGPDWSESYEAVRVALDRGTASKKLGPRRDAEAKREAMLRQAVYLEEQRIPDTSARGDYLETLFEAEENPTEPKASPPSAPEADPETYSRENFRTGARRRNPEDD